MKKYLNLMSIAVIATAILIGCKKENITAAKTKTQLLTEKTWKYVKFEEKTNSTDPWTDATGTYQPCELDNIMTFASAGSYTETEGAYKCYPSDPDLVERGDWSFQSNETILRLIVGGFLIINTTIETLDANTLRFSFEYPFSSGFERITMGH